MGLFVGFLYKPLLFRAVRFHSFAVLGFEFYLILVPSDAKCDRKKIVQASKKPNNSHVLITLIGMDIMLFDVGNLLICFFFSFLPSPAISWRPIKNDSFN